MTTRKQRTVGKIVEYSGVGIHTGHDVLIRFIPAEIGEGIYFKRIDLPGEPIIPAAVEYVFDTSRSTNLAINDVRIYTVEHVLAAVRAYEIDNLCIELSAHEPPAGNGSSDVFVDMIHQAGIVEQSATKTIVSLQNPVYHSEGDVHLVAIPSDEYRLSYTLHYPQTKALGSQYFSLALTAESFTKELAPCRTFALYEEISFLMDRGLIKGGSLDNAVVVKDEAVISKNGLFFPDEMVRHKVLDMVGDLSLIGIQCKAHIIAIRSGHPANFRFAQKLYSQLSLENR
ncbi:MAG: UDP-3-O-acyl-N-acetylglucosamine deacetylase [Verrucomicrobia bacterium]|nr:UDP-3-O-acyl-N-acetylglucosamine deacetylase [Verrucomicrobiota bacterium]MBS0637556.1 UDP-3-O-acyl-N-acetylglucosamine deacetylase [Verrucomicrobiota bacterium]